MENDHTDALWCTVCCSRAGAHRKARVDTSLGFHNGIVIRRRKLDSSDCSCQRDTKLRIDQDRNLVYGHKPMDKCAPCRRSKLGRICVCYNCKVDLIPVLQNSIKSFTFHIGASCYSDARTILLQARLNFGKGSFSRFGRNGNAILMIVDKAGKGRHDKGRRKSEDSPLAHMT